MKFNISIYGEQNPRQRRDIFKCHEPIIVALNKLYLKGSHTLQVHWFRPDGKRQETTRTRYVEFQNVTQNVEFKLVIKPKQFSFFDPMVFWIPFVGRWEVRIFVDNDIIDKKFFRLEC